MRLLLLQRSINDNVLLTDFVFHPQFVNRVVDKIAWNLHVVLELMTLNGDLPGIHSTIRRGFFIHYLLVYLCCLKVLLSELLFCWTNLITIIISDDFILLVCFFLANSLLLARLSSRLTNPVASLALFAPHHLVSVGFWCRKEVA